MNGFGKREKLIPDILPISAPGLADIDYRIEFLAAVVERLAGFGKFDGGGVPAVGKANGRAGVDRGSSKQFSAPGQVVWQDADACHVIPSRQRTTFFEFPSGQGGVEQRVIDHFGN